MSLRGFDVYNDEDEGLQAVIALIEADDQRIKRFLNAAKAKKHQLAEVGDITSEDYTGEVMHLWQTAAMNAYGQMNKAIPILLGVNQSLGDKNGKMDMMIEMQGQTVEEIKGLREDMASQHQDIQTIEKQVGLRR